MEKINYIYFLQKSNNTLCTVITQILTLHSHFTLYIFDKNMNLCLLKNSLIIKHSTKLDTENNSLIDGTSFSLYASEKYLKNDNHYVFINFIDITGYC